MPHHLQHIFKTANNFFPKQKTKNPQWISFRSQMQKYSGKWNAPKICEKLIKKIENFPGGKDAFSKANKTAWEGQGANLEPKYFCLGVCVCTSACMCARERVCAYSRDGLCLPIIRCMCMWVSVYACVSERLCICVGVLICVYMQLYIFAFTSAYVYLCAFILQFLIYVLPGIKTQK